MAIGIALSERGVPSLITYRSTTLVEDLYKAFDTRFESPNIALMLSPRTGERDCTAAFENPSALAY